MILVYILELEPDEEEKASVRAKYTNSFTKEVLI